MQRSYIHSVLKTKVYTPGDFKGSFSFDRVDIVCPVFTGSGLGMRGETLGLYLRNMIDIRTLG